jgi:hypothetical protein
MFETRRAFTPYLSLGLALIAGSLLGGAAAAAELDEHATRLLVVADAADGATPQSFELDELSEGQAQQFTTDAGTKVVVTRTADGYDVDIDGDKSSVKLALPEVEPGEDGAAGPHTRVIVHQERHGDAAAAQAYAFVVTDDASRDAVVTEISQVLVGGDGETNVLVTPGDGKHVRVVRVLGGQHAGATAEGAKAQKIVIIERKTESKPAGDDQH